MSRIGSGDTYQVKPSSNVYTVLAIIATIASIGALVAIYLRAETLFGPGGITG